MTMPPPMPLPMARRVTPPIPMPADRSTIAPRPGRDPSRSRVAVPPRADLGGTAPARGYGMGRAGAGGSPAARRSATIGHRDRGDSRRVPAQPRVAGAIAPPQLIAANSPAPSGATAPLSAVPMRTPPTSRGRTRTGDPGDTGARPVVGSRPVQDRGVDDAGRLDRHASMVRSPARRRSRSAGHARKRKLDIAHPRYAIGDALDHALSRNAADESMSRSHGRPTSCTSRVAARARSSRSTAIGRAPAPTMVKMMGFTTLIADASRSSASGRGRKKVYSKVAARSRRGPPRSLELGH